MSNPAVLTTLIAHDKALEAAGESIALALKIPAPLKPIADQVIRAAKSEERNKPTLDFFHGILQEPLGS